MNINTAKLFKLKKQVMKESSELHYLKERLNRVQGTGGKAEQKAKEAVDEQSYKLSEIVVQYDNEKKKLADEIVTVEGKAKERKISVELIMLQCWQI